MRQKRAHIKFQTLILAGMMVLFCSTIKAGEPGKVEIKFSPAVETYYEMTFTSIRGMQRNLQINAAATGSLQKRKKSDFERVLHFDPRVKFVLGKNMYLQLSYN